MGAMVGGGTGAVMTAVTMIFEMTRDYDIVLPMILAVAISVGVRRLLSRENIYTLKLVRRGHVIPKALHANMFLVRRAKEVMDTDVVLAPADMTFDAFLAQPEHAGRMRHVVVIEGNRILGVLRVNTALRQRVGGSTLRRHPARRRQPQLHHRARGRHRLRRDPAHVAQARDDGARRHAAAACRAPEDVAGVITKEHVAEFRRQQRQSVSDLKSHSRAGCLREGCQTMIRILSGFPENVVAVAR